MDASTSPCLASMLSLSGDRVDFGLALGLVQEVPFRFPRLTSVYWYGVTPVRRSTSPRYDIYSVTIVNFPIRHYTTCKRFIDVFVRSSRYPDGRYVDDNVWIHILWTLHRPDLSRIIWTST